jgi:hypothetical protein
MQQYGLVNPAVVQKSLACLLASVRSPETGVDLPVTKAAAVDARVKIEKRCMLIEDSAKLDRRFQYV